MRAWRIAQAAFADLSGTGGLHVAGRWHSRGRPIVYTAESVALAQLEVRVHMDVPARFLPDFVLMAIEWPDDLLHAVIADDLIADGRAPRDELPCRERGDAWLAEASTAVAVVPSVVTPYSRNWLVNPLHPDARHVRIEAAEPFVPDPRLYPAG